MKLSVIIVNFNTKEYLLECLQSLYSCPPTRSFEVIIVDNASSDGSRQMVEESFPQARFIGNPSNIGFAAANNVGIATASGEHILLLNPDTVILKGAIDALCGTFDRFPEAGVAGGRLLNGDGTIQPSIFSYPTIPVVLGWFRSRHCPRRRLADPEFLRISHSAVKEIEAPIGAFFLVRRAVFSEIGLLDENFFVYAEEIDLCLRARRKGWKVLFNPDAEIVHHGGGATSKLPVKSFIFWIRSHRYFYRKHYGATSKVVLDLIILADIVADLLRDCCLWASTRDRKYRQRIHEAKRIVQEAFGGGRQSPLSVKPR